MSFASNKINLSGFLPIDKQHFIVFAVFSLLYLSWTNFVMGFRTDHMNFYIFIFFYVFFAPMDSNGGVQFYFFYSFLDYIRFHAYLS